MLHYIVAVSTGEIKIHYSLGYSNNTLRQLQLHRGQAFPQEISISSAFPDSRMQNSISWTNTLFNDRRELSHTGREIRLSRSNSAQILLLQEASFLRESYPKLFSCHSISRIFLCQLRVGKFLCFNNDRHRPERKIILNPGDCIRGFVSSCITFKKTIFIIEIVNEYPRGICIQEKQMADDYLWDRFTSRYVNANRNLYILYNIFYLFYEYWNLI